MSINDLGNFSAPTIQYRRIARMRNSFSDRKWFSTNVGKKNACVMPYSLICFSKRWTSKVFSPCFNCKNSSLQWQLSLSQNFNFKILLSGKHIKIIIAYISVSFYLTILHINSISPSQNHCFLCPYQNRRQWKCSLHWAKLNKFPAPSYQMQSL